MKKVGFVLALVILASLAHSVALAGEVLSPGTVAAPENANKYLNTVITVRGRVAGYTKNPDDLNYNHMYNITDKRGSLMVHTNQFVEDGDAVTITGKLISEDGMIFLVEQSGPQIPVWMIAVGAALLITLVVVIVMIVRGGGSEKVEQPISQAVPAANFCDQCRTPLGSDGKCPQCSRRDIPTPISGKETVGFTVPTSRPATILMEAPPKAMLVLKDGHNGNSKSVNLSTGAKKIGRSSDCDFVLAEDTVSGEHAKVIEENGRFYVQDLGSRNGTYVNQEKIVKQILSDGDQVRFGKAEMKFVELSEK